MRYSFLFALVLVFLISCTPATDQALANTPAIPSITTPIPKSATQTAPANTATILPVSIETQTKRFQPILVKDKLWVDAIAVDSAQNIWLIGLGDVTDNKYSLINYDGRDWYVYEIPMNMVSCYAGAPLRIADLAIDANGSVWGNSGCRIFRFDRGNWTAYSRRNGIAQGSISALVVDHIGNIWVGTDQGFLTRYDGKKWEAYRPSDSTNLDTIDSIIALPDDTLWFGGRGGISYFDGNHWVTYKHQDKYNQPIDATEITALKDGRVWVLEENGEATIFYFNGNDWKALGGIENVIRTSIFAEQNGNVWVGALDKLFHSSGAAWLEIPIPTVTGIAQAQDGMIWFGTHGGLYRYNSNQ